MAELKKNKGSLTVLSGFSGAGKGTIMKELVKKYDNYCLSVSVTTRDPRPGEIDGKDYFFISQEEFDRKVAAGELLEHAGYVGHCYGTPRAYVEEKIAEGKDVLLEIEVQGGTIVKKQMLDTIMLFVTTKDPDTLISRLKNRGTETDDVIRERLERALRESEEITPYDEIIVNDDLTAAVEEVNATIMKYKERHNKNANFINEFRAGLADELKSMVI